MAQHLTNAQLTTLITPALRTACAVTSVSKANPAVCLATTNLPTKGDYVLLYGSGTDFATPVCVQVTVVVAATSFSVAFDNTGGTGGVQTVAAYPFSAGIVANLQPYNLDGLQDFLSRIPNTNSYSEEGSATNVETTIGASLAALGGLNP